MSYDVRLEIDTGGEHPASVTETQSPTYNIGPMLRDALGMNMQKSSGAPHLDGMLASEALPLVENALFKMASNPAHYEAMNPPNGWGSTETAVEFLRWLAHECQRHPKAVVRV